MNLRDAELEQSLDRPGFRLRGTSIREALGGELIGGTIYEFDPGEQLWPYHFHRGNEEWLVVVAGTPSLRTPDGERELRPATSSAFPRARPARTRSTTAATSSARLAIFSSLRKGSAVYLDSGKVGVAGQVFRTADEVDYWDGEESGA